MTPDTQHRRPAVTVEVFQGPSGEFHSAIVNRRGRLLWQSAAHATHAAAQARGECERTARYLRHFVRSEAAS